MSVQTVSPERAVEVLTIELESKQDKIAELKAKIDEQAATIARLTAAHEMQGESLVVLPRWMVSNMEDKLKAQAEEIRTLKDALTRITHTGVTLGNNQSAWDAWRLCATIANEALK